MTSDKRIQGRCNICGSQTDWYYLAEKTGLRHHCCIQCWKKMKQWIITENIEPRTYTKGWKSKLPHPKYDSGIDPTEERDECKKGDNWAEKDFPGDYEFYQPNQEE